MTLGPSPIVQRWMDARPVSALATTTINIAEVRFGLARLPFGLRRRRMETLFDNFLARAIDNRVFGFDARAANTFAELAAARESSGRPLRSLDGLIAAIAASRGLSIATRNTADFADCGLDVVNPWEAAAL
jgi:predicted nucleic acid-binding protein